MNPWSDNVSAGRSTASAPIAPQNEGTEDQPLGAFFEGHDHPHYSYYDPTASLQSLDPNQHAQSLNPLGPWSPFNTRTIPAFDTTSNNPSNQVSQIPNMMQPMQGGGYYQDPLPSQDMHSLAPNQDILYTFTSGACEHPQASSESAVDDHNNAAYLDVSPRPPTSLSDEDEFLPQSMAGRMRPEARSKPPDTRHGDSNHLSPHSKRDETSPLRGPRRAKSITVPDELECRFDDCRSRFHGEYRKSNLARHIRLRHDRGGRTYTCEGGCGKIFNRQDARLKHYRRQHPYLASAPPIPRKN